jgi:hypothetical protein
VNDGGGSVLDASTSEGGYVFEDAFDDPTPLPRQWSTVTEQPVLVLDGGRSAPGLLNVIVPVSSPMGFAKYVAKTMATPGATEFECRYAVRVRTAGGGGPHATAVLSVGDLYIEAQTLQDRVHFYGPNTNGGAELPSFNGDHVEGLLSWQVVSLAITRDGRVTFGVVGQQPIVKETGAPTDASSFRFVLGYPRGNQSATTQIDADFDDVRCEAK